MSNTTFSNPVQLELRNTGRRVIANPWEAIEVLHGHWPHRARGRTYRSAYRACRDALDGLRKPHEARRAFMAVARRAGMSVG
ncbi:DUF982 domain-containing protein [Mesorhizobium sp. A623]